MQNHDLAFIRRISVKDGLSLWQKLVLFAVAGIFIAGVIGLLFAAADPSISDVALLPGRLFVTAAIMVFAAIGAVMIILVTKSEEGIARIDGDLLPDEACPLYTVFVPCYKEGEVLRELVANIAALDYPKQRLEVYLILEEDDNATRSVAAALALPPYMQVVIVPREARGPKGKPRAMMHVVNLGMVHGEVLVIFDAEDRPDPDQLRKAATAAALRLDIACFQAQLRWWNAEQNVFTRALAASYAMHFALKLPGLAATQGVFPLGGTSNHIRVSALRNVGWWDPSNVTEDLGLGVSLSRAGYRSLVLDSVTLEEATTSFKAQIKQSSRWIKGHTATLVAHTRHPWKLYRDLGPWGSMTFLVVVAAPHPATLAAPLFWAMTTLYALTGADVIEKITPALAYYVGTLCLLANAGYLWAAMLAALKSRQPRLVPWMVLLPLYWATVLLCAAVKAGWEIASGRLTYWDKTQHGIATPLPQHAPVPHQSFRPVAHAHVLSTEFVGEYAPPETLRTVDRHVGDD